MPTPHLDNLYLREGAGKHRGRGAIAPVSPHPRTHPPSLWGGPLGPLGGAGVRESPAGVPKNRIPHLREHGMRAGLKN